LSVQTARNPIELVDFKSYFKHGPIGVFHRFFIASNASSPFGIREQPALEYRVLRRFISIANRRPFRKEERRMKIRPLGDRILLKRIEEEEKSKGGIIIPDTAKEKPQQGKVVAVGKGKLADDGKLIPMEVKPGDTILFAKYSGSEVKIDGEEHLIMREDDILGIIG
jgi:chaperonin GroES